MKSSSASSHRCRSSKSSVQPPSLLQLCAPLCQQLSSLRSQAPWTQEPEQLPLVIFKIRCNSQLFGSAQIKPERKPEPAGARTDPSLDSCNVQVVLIHVLRYCQQMGNYLSCAHLLDETTPKLQFPPIITILFTIKGNLEAMQNRGKHTNLVMRHISPVIKSISSIFL